MLALALDVACAMLHLHSQSILHGDLKSSNVLLRQAPVASAPAAGVLMSSPACAAGASVTLGSVPGARLVAKVREAALGSSSRTCLPPTCFGHASLHSGHARHRSMHTTPGRLCGVLQSGCTHLHLCLVCQVADFGLSTSIDPDATHLSHVHAVSMSMGCLAVHSQQCFAAVLPDGQKVACLLPMAPGAADTGCLHHHTLLTCLRCCLYFT